MIDQRLEKLQEAVIEMYSDWKKGDFQLPKLAQHDLTACFVAANCGEQFAAPTQPVREPLTDERIKEITGASDVYWAHSKLFILGIARAVEAAIKEPK